MEYDNFIEFIKNRAVTTAGEGGKVFINKVVKNNGKQLDGLVILEEGYSVAPAIYLNDYYEDFKAGKDLDDIMNNILSVYYRNRDSVCFDPEFFNDYENLKNRIIYKVVNYEKNKEMLKDVPHKKFLDLAIVYYCIVQHFEDNIATTIIKNEYLKKWNVSDKDIFTVAQKNTPKLLEARIAPITYFLNELSGEKIYRDDDNNEPAMYVLTNTTHINGAGCILYDGVIKDFSDRLERDLYILPSSVHELIIVPKDEKISPTELADIVQEINAKGVAEDEILSDSVYVYDRKSKKILVKKS